MSKPKTRKPRTANTEIRNPNVDDDNFEIVPGPKLISILKMARVDAAIETAEETLQKLKIERSAILKEVNSFLNSYSKNIEFSVGSRSKKPTKEGSRPYYPMEVRILSVLAMDSTRVFKTSEIADKAKIPAEYVSNVMSSHREGGDFIKVKKGQYQISEKGISKIAEIVSNM